MLGEITVDFIKHVFALDGFLIFFCFTKFT